MNIFTVRDNLKNTILGKKLLLAEYKAGKDESVLIRSVMTQVLQNSIDELTKILEDVEISCKESRKVAFKALKLELILDVRQDTVQQLREAISKAPHALHCLAIYNDCGWPRQKPKPEKCDCWKKDI